MKKTLLFLLLLLSAQGFAQVQRTAVFDFTAPKSLNPQMSPGSSNGSFVPVTDMVFTCGQISISFSLPDGVLDTGAQYLTRSFDGGETLHYCLQLNNRTSMIVTGNDGATLNSLSCPNDNYCEKGALGMTKTDGSQGYIDVNEPPFTWKNNTGNELTSVSFTNSGGASSKLTTITVYYTTPSDILVPSASISNGGTVASFDGLTLTFDRSMYSNTTGDITLSNGTTKQPLTAKVDGSVVTLTPQKAITTDGTYIVTVPAKRFKASDGYENAALTYTFKVSTPKDTFTPITIDPAQGTVTSLNSPITLTFDKVVADFTPFKVALYKDGEENRTVTVSKVSDYNVQLAFSATSGITENGTYTITIPEGKIENDALSPIHNPSFTLQYVIDGSEPVTPPTKDSETMKLAKSLLGNTGVGYPSASSAARTALAALTTAEQTPTDDELQTAIDAFYAETDVTLPTGGKYYQIAGVNASGTRAYLSYKDGSVTLTTSKAGAATFAAEEQGTATAFKTTDGKYLHVLCADNKHNATSTKNVTDAYNATVSNLSLAKFAVEGASASSTFGLLSVYGSLGVKNNTSVEERAYASISYGTSLDVTTDPDYSLLFSNAESSAFQIYEASAPAADTATVETSYTLNVSSDKKMLTLKLDVEGDVNVNPNAPATKIATSEGTPIESAQFTKAQGADYQFTVTLGTGYTEGKFMLLIPRGTFLYTKDGNLVQTDSIAASFDLGSGSGDHGGKTDDKAKFDTSYSQFTISPDNMSPVRDTDLNNFVVSIVAGDYTALVPNPNVTDSITLYSDKSALYRTGHFETYTIPENPSRPAIHLVLDEPIKSGDLRDNQYAIILPEGAFGDANFGKYLADKTSVSSTVCKVNPRWALSYNVSSSATGIDGIEADDSASQTIYDLMGRKVERITRPGIYIVNGKKVVRK